MKLGRTYIKNNGMTRVTLIGVHPSQDLVAISSGTDRDVRFVTFYHFATNYTLDNSSGDQNG